MMVLMIGGGYAYYFFVQRPKMLAAGPMGMYYSFFKGLPQGEQLMNVWQAQQYRGPLIPGSEVTTGEKAANVAAAFVGVQFVDATWHLALTNRNRVLFATDNEIKHTHDRGNIRFFAQHEAFGAQPAGTSAPTYASGPMQTAPMALVAIETPQSRTAYWIHPEAVGILCQWSRG